MGLSRRREALVHRLRRRKTREREGLFLVEGVRGATDAVRRAGEVHFGVCSPRLRTLEGGEALVGALESAGVDLSWVDDEALEGLSDTDTPQGVLLVCREPGRTLGDVLPAADRGLLLLDGVQDPGNVGTLIRAAAAFGVGGVVALDGTVDPWNAKAVRASAGALFSTPVVAVPWKEAAPGLREADVEIVVSDADGVDVATWPGAPRWALVVGNEGRGVRPAVAAAAGATLGIPMAGDAESLNVGVAAAILLYALRRGTPA